VVLCVDEKSQIRRSTASPRSFDDAGTPNDAARLPTPWDHEPVRRIGHASGKVIGSLHDVTGQRVQEVPHPDRPRSADGLDVHLILDNYGPTRHPTFTGGYSDTRGSTCISRQHRARGSTWWNGGSAVDHEEDQARSPHQRPEPREDIREWIALWKRTLARMSG